MSWIFYFFCQVIFLLSCIGESISRDYSTRELSDFMETLSLKFTEIEKVLEKQKSLNRQYEEKLKAQDVLIKTLNKRLSYQSHKIKQCENLVKEERNALESLIHTLMEKPQQSSQYHNTTNSVRMDDRTPTNAKQRQSKPTSPYLRQFVRDTQEQQNGECVAFSVYLNRRLTDLGPDHTIQHGGVVLNEGNAYNVHTGVFTTPTNGIYLFTFSAEDYTDHRIWVKVVVDGELRSSVIIHAHGSYRTMGSNSVILRLSAGESVWMAVDTNESGDTIEGSSTVRATTFSGILLCQ